MPSKRGIAVAWFEDLFRGVGGHVLRFYSGFKV